MTPLGSGTNFASDINASGQVVGRAYIGGIESHAFITGANGVGMTDLGTLGGNYSLAYGINASGQVVGYSLTETGEGHAFVTGPDGVGMTDLGPGIAYDINDAGQVVGSSRAQQRGATLFLPHRVALV